MYKLCLNMPQFLKETVTCTHKTTMLISYTAATVVMHKKSSFESRMPFCVAHEQID